MNNKGFTLIELMATVTIMGFVSLIVYPSISSAISSNNSSSCKYYEKTVVSASKRFIQKESVDIKEAYGGNFPSSYRIDQSTLVNSGYIDDYNDSKTSVRNIYVIVRYNSSNNTYTYESHLTCLNKGGKNIYNS